MSYFELKAGVRQESRFDTEPKSSDDENLDLQTSMKFWLMGILNVKLAAMIAALISISLVRKMSFPKTMSEPFTES